MENKINGTDGEASLARLTTAFMPYIQKKARTFKAAGIEHDDLEQEGLIALYNAIESFNESYGTAFSTYAITCINNRMVSAVKQAARKKHLPLNGYLSLSDDDTANLIGGYSPEDLAIALEGYNNLQNRINDNLSDFEREVLSLYLEGYDYLAVAKRLNASPKSVDNALQRARKKLRPRQ